MYVIFTWGYQHTLQFYGKIFWNKAIAQANLTKANERTNEVSEQVSGKATTAKQRER